MQIKKLSVSNAKDFASLIQIFNEVFENENRIPNQKYLKSLLANPDFLVFVYIKDNQVVGGLTVYVLQQYFSQKPQAYIYDVGVNPEYQRQGIGKSLILAVCNYCQENGFENAYVEAESQDIEAIKFYKSTPYSSVLKAVHYTYLFK